MGWRQFHADDLKRLKKDDMIALFLEMQEYMCGLEGKMNSTHQWVRVSKQSFSRHEELLPEFLDVLRTIALIESSEYGHNKGGNWVMQGQIRSWIRTDSLATRNDWTDWWTQGFLVTKEQKDALQAFLLAMTKHLDKKREQFKQEGRNFLIQSIQSDILGDATK